MVKSLWCLGFNPPLTQDWSLITICTCIFLLSSVPGTKLIMVLSHQLILQTSWYTKTISSSLSLSPRRMCKTNFKGKCMLLTYGKTGSCDMWKRKRQIHNYYRFYFLKCPQIIAFKYKQGHLQEWLFYLHLVCFKKYG